MNVDVVIVGGGLAGLCCARQLHEHGVSFVVLEAGKHVGGRVRTDFVDGFKLDRGFQVLVTAYPEARRVLDYRALDLRAFAPGALVRLGGRFHQVIDPWRQPASAIGALFSPIGSWRDKLRLARLRWHLFRGTARTATTTSSTLESLVNEGFSPKIIESFFRPFFGGVFLDRELRADRRLFDFLFRMFAQGDTCVPAAGMQAIPDQLVDALPAGSVRCMARVERIADHTVQIAGGEALRPRAIVVATSGPEARRLVPSLPAVGSRRVDCLYFSAPEPPIRRPVLCLNGEGRGLVNNVAVMSEVAPSYAPPNSALISVSVLGNDRNDTAWLERDVRAHMAEWFGSQVKHWQLLRHLPILHALPTPAWNEPHAPARLQPGLYVCGDHCVSASIQGAMQSGSITAQAVVNDLQK